MTVTMLIEGIEIAGRWLLRLGARLLRAVSRRVTRKIARKNLRLRQKLLRAEKKNRARIYRKLQRGERRLAAWRKVLRWVESWINKKAQDYVERALKVVEGYVGDDVPDIPQDALSVERQAANKAMRRAA